MGARRNLHVPVFASAARTASVNSRDFPNHLACGVHLVIDVTAVSGTAPTLTVTLRGKDPTSGKYYTLLASAVINAAGTTVLKVYPGITAAANLAVNDVLPLDWRVEAVIGGTTPSFTFSIGAHLIT